MRNWKEWLKAAGIRAVKTIAQTVAAMIGTGMIFIMLIFLAVFLSDARLHFRSRMISMQSTIVFTRRVPLFFLPSKKL